MKAVIELVSNICNSSCRWCFTQYKSSEVINKCFMTDNNFKKIILLNKGLKIIPFSHGEALLHKGFNNLITFALKNNCTMNRIHSNFAMDLDKEHFENLVNFRFVTVNIGGATEKTHFLNMKTDFNKVIGNLTKLCAYKKNTKSDVVIELKMVLNKINRKDKEKLKKLGKKIDKCIKVSTFPIYFTTSDSTQAEMKRFYDNNIDERVPCRDIIKEENGLIKVVSKSVNDICCNHILTVRYNGLVQMCCRPRSQEGIVGDALTTSLIDIKNSDIYRKNLRKLINREYISYCKHCS